MKKYYIKWAKSSNNNTFFYIQKKICNVMLLFHEKYFNKVDKVSTCDCKILVKF